MKEILQHLLNRMRHLRTPLARSQQGQALVYTLIILTFGTMVTSGFLVYTGTMVRVGGEDEELLLDRYAADAGVTEVISDLIQGEDALDPGYTIPTPIVNDQNVNIVISAPTPGTEPAAVYHYIDPGVSYGLESIDSQTTYYFRMDNVEASSDIRVNWDFTPSDQWWRIRLYEGTGPPGAPDPTILAQDDFESNGWTGGTGWDTDWTLNEPPGNTSIVSDSSPYEGTYHMQLLHNDGYVKRAVNLLGQTNVRLQFWAKAVDFELGETATCSVSYNGVDWTVVRVWQDGEDDNVYRFEDIDLSPYTMSSQFWISFSSNMNGTGDYFWVDAVSIISQVISSPIAENSDTKGPGALLVDGSLITGGAYTLGFTNNSGTTLVSSTFSSEGGAGSADNTWIYAQAYKDYIVSSTAGDSTIIAYVRQAPGPTNPVTGQHTYIESWQEP
ncbi:hypothetical protein ACFLW2_02755 [Chloroflexota bacterium]